MEITVSYIFCDSTSCGDNLCCFWSSLCWWCWRRTSGTTWPTCSSVCPPCIAQSSLRTIFRIWPTNTSDSCDYLLPRCMRRRATTTPGFYAKTLHKNWAHKKQEAAECVLKQCSKLSPTHTTIWSLYIFRDATRNIFFPLERFAMQI